MQKYSSSNNDYWYTVTLNKDQAVKCTVFRKLPHRLPSVSEYSALKHAALKCWQDHE